MFNQTNVNNSKTEIKAAATGIIQRSNENSFFLKFHHGSRLADELFEPTPMYKNKSINIIQMLLIGEGYILAECIYLD